MLWRPATATAISLVALCFSLSGAAFAANHYIITRGARSTLGARDPEGQDGKDGPAEGPQRRVGATGATGAAGGSGARCRRSQPSPETLSLVRGDRAQPSLAARAAFYTRRHRAAACKSAMARQHVDLVHLITGWPHRSVPERGTTRPLQRSRPTGTGTELPGRQATLTAGAARALGSDLVVHERRLPDAKRRQPPELRPSPTERCTRSGAIAIYVNSTATLGRLLFSSTPPGRLPRPAPQQLQPSSDREIATTARGVWSRFAPAARSARRTDLLAQAHADERT